MSAMKPVTIGRNGKALVITGDGASPPPVSSGWDVAPLHEMRDQIRQNGILPWMFLYEDAVLYTPRLDALWNPFKSAVLLRSLSYRRCEFRDELGRQVPITPAQLARLGTQWVSDWFKRPALLKQVRADLRELQRQAPFRPSHLDLSARPIYLRTDLCFGLRSGGSVGHIAGVLNHLDEFAGKPVMLTSDWIPTVRSDVEVHRIGPDGSFMDSAELANFHFNRTFEAGAAGVLRSVQPAFVYQRYSLNNFTGVKLARQLGVPFVLEFNGSEVWIHQNWGRGLKYAALSAEIEAHNLQAADLIVVVSRALKDALIAANVEPEKILVNPNGVQPNAYSPDVDGTKVRQQYGCDGRTVVGFIGTFGRWHGAEVLAEAFGQLLKQHPEYRQQVRLLMVGDGMTMPEVRRRIDEQGIADAVILTGLVPQEQGPPHLAACDILASPHVPNPDGTPFFGSPTKLFEYMAMGKGVVASRLDQIDEILKHEHTAWMVEPNNVAALTAGLKTLIDNPALRSRLGQEARRAVVAQFTWREHTRRIIDALEARVTAGQPTSRAA